jgi:uncharacterized protein involved in exopolysaccharide biosynthesis
MAMCLYPAEWRKRYGAEFQYLLDDVQAGWRDLLDVLLGGVKIWLTEETFMHISRTFKIVMGVAALALLLAAGWKMEAEPEYEATTVVIVDPAHATDVAGVTAALVNLGTGDRLSMVKDQLLSTTRLQRIIDVYDLYKPLRGHKTQMEIIERMRSDIQVDVIQYPGGGAVRAFRITYRGPKAPLVAQVTNQLASLFIEENLKIRNVGVDPLNKRLVQLRDQLKTGEASLRAAKSPEDRAMQARDLGLMRDYYAKLFVQKLEAETASQMDQSRRFTILDPARIPEKPARYRPRFLTASW